MIRRRSQRIHDKVKLSSPSSNSGDGNHMDMRLNKIHDYFNLICLPFICACYVWHMNTLYNMPKDPDPITIFSLPRHSNNSNAWFYNYWTFNIYIIIDTLWILLYPRCVASPNTLLAHHVVCVIGWQLCSLSQWGDGNDNHYQFNWEYYISAGLCVEFNTYFLILKRQLPKPKPPNDNDNERVFWDKGFQRNKQPKRKDIRRFRNRGNKRTGLWKQDRANALCIWTALR